MYLIGTSVLSALRPGKPQAGRRVRAGAATVPQSGFFPSAFTVLEHEIGIVRFERRQPPEGGAMRVWWDAARAAFAGRVLRFSMKKAMLCAPLHLPDKRSLRDSMIAATARSHGFTVVTHDVDDFKAVAGIKLLNLGEYAACDSRNCRLSPCRPLHCGRRRNASTPASERSASSIHGGLCCLSSLPRAADLRTACSERRLFGRPLPALWLSALDHQRGSQGRRERQMNADEKVRGWLIQTTATSAAHARHCPYSVSSWRSTMKPCGASAAKLPGQL